MDSHLFRRVAAVLEPELAGRRIQKIFGPAPGVVTLDLGKGGPEASGRFLVLRWGNKDPLLFTAWEKPRNPEQPEARIMWLRKRLMGRRLRAQHCDWAGRRLAWELSGMRGDVPLAAGGDGRVLLLCLREGLSLLDALPDGFDSEPSWPDFEQLFEALHSADSPEMEALWRAHPQLSPILRRTLATLPKEDARQLYLRLQRGESSRFYVYVHEQQGQSRAEALAWQLPESLRQGRDERSFPQPQEAAAYAGSVTLFSQLARDEDAEERGVRKRALKRLKRGLAKMAQEERRMQGLVSLRRKGRALQGLLWQMDPERKLHHVEAPDYEAAATSQDGEAPLVRVELDPSLSIAENMERFFRLAAKGERGLPLVQARRKLLEEELEALRQGRAPLRDIQGRELQKQNVPQKKAGKAKKDIALQRFRSSDGFLLLRGRNKAANHKLLSQAANPYDIWFHAQDGPGAHLVLKRDHPRQEPPRKTMLEAAALAGLKGWQAQDDRARVICALVKDVRKIKGADLGQVAVDKVLEAFQVPLDAELETRLKVE